MNGTVPEWDIFKGNCKSSTRDFVTTSIDDAWKYNPANGFSRSELVWCVFYCSFVYVGIKIKYLQPDYIDYITG